jgi:hypothetical protein
METKIDGNQVPWCMQPNEVRHHVDREGPIVCFLTLGLGVGFFVPIFDFPNVPYGWKHTILCFHKLPNGFNDIFPMCFPKLFMIAPHFTPIPFAQKGYSCNLFT